MSKEGVVPRGEAARPVTLNGQQYWRDEAGVLHEISESPVYEPRTGMDELLGDTANSMQKEAPRVRLRRRLGAGVLAASLIAVPVAAHVGGEVATNAIINAIDPRDDKVLNPDQLMADLGKTWSKMVKGEF